MSRPFFFFPVAFIAAPSLALAGFDWGGDCSSGSGEFEQFVPDEALVTVGDIPAGKADVRIDLTSPEDVDVQLLDALTGAAIIAWPDGLLSGPSQDCVVYEDVQICWSGYNGDQTAAGLGNEWIEVRGVTTRELTMRAYGYDAGDATVEYAFSTTPTCGEVGEGSFAQWIALDAVTTVGQIPAGKVAVEVELQAPAGADVDIQLIDDISGEALVAWPDGQLNGAGEQSLDWYGMTITWSGYNGIDGDWGHEMIEISGATTRPLTMRAYGYQAGQAAVDYEWGDGVGATCMGIAALQCDDGLYCKAMQVGVADGAGSCHTELWCGGQESAEADCANVMHPMIPGFFSCEDYRCAWNGCQALPGGWRYVSQDVSFCQVVRYVCEPGEQAFGSSCGCGCRPG